MSGPYQWNVGEIEEVPDTRKSVEAVSGFIGGYVKIRVCEPGKSVLVPTARTLYVHLSSVEMVGKDQEEVAESFWQKWDERAAKRAAVDTSNCVFLFLFLNLFVC